LGTPPPFTQESSPLRRLTLPFLYGLVGIGITLAIDKIHSINSALLLSSFLAIFIITHIWWCQKIVQSERQKFKKIENTAPSESSSLDAFKVFKEERSQDLLVGETFLKKAINQLAIPHPLHFQASSLQEPKTHLLQTKGLVSLLQDNQLETFVQTIVNLPQKRLAFLSCIPCLTVGSGITINLNTLAAVSSNVPSTQAFDWMILCHILQFVRHNHMINPHYGFMGRLPVTVYEDKACFEDLWAFLCQTHFPFQSLIFEVPLDIPESTFANFLPLQQAGVRFIGNAEDNPPLVSLTNWSYPPVDFVKLSYGKIMKWLCQQPRRHGLASLQQMLEICPPFIISQIPQEQEFYRNLPLTFDYGAGRAFGVVKPFSHIQL